MGIAGEGVAIKSVSRFEANLLRVLQSFLGQAPASQAAKLVMRHDAAPPCLSRAAVDLIQDFLKKGVVTYLAQSGWKQERFLRNGSVVTGRLWERTSPEQLGLTFSGHSLEFLLWLMTTAARDKKPKWQPAHGKLTVGDRFLFFLAMHCLRKSGEGHVLARHGIMHQDGLIRLAFPDLMPHTQAAIVWTPWTTGVGACILESLQCTLSNRWLEIERGKEGTTDAKVLVALGQSQDAVLSGFAESLTTAGRWDLARFLLQALVELLRDAPSASRWVGQLKLDSLRLAARMDAQRAALALVRCTATLQQWDAQARTIGYFDEGYAAAQLWKSDWEAAGGAQLCQHADAILREIEPLKS
jgi:hypothetical protein